MKKAIVKLAVVIALGVCPALSIAGVTDIYVSFADFGAGNAENNTTTSAMVGTSGSAFIWIDENYSVDTGAFLDVLNDNAGVLEFTGAEVFNPNITIGGANVDTRWQSVGDQGLSATFIDELNGFSVTEGTGILPNQATGGAGPFFDSGHDPSSNAFLFARIDYDVVGVGSANITLATGDGLVVDNNVNLVPDYGSAKLNGIAVPEPTSAALLAVGLVGLVARRRR